MEHMHLSLKLSKITIKDNLKVQTEKSNGGKDNIFYKLEVSKAGKFTLSGLAGSK